MPLNQANDALLYAINGRPRGKCPPPPINPGKITIAICLTPFLCTFIII